MKLYSLIKNLPKELQVKIFLEKFANLINQILDLLNDRILKGSKIRAQYVAEISLSSLGSDSQRIQAFDSKNVEVPNYHKDDYLLNANTQNDDQESEEEPEPETEKPSIFSRIKKNNN